MVLVLFWHHLGAPQGAEWRSSSAGGAERASSPCLAEGFLFSLSLGSSAGKAFSPKEREVGQDQASSDLNLMGNVLVAAPLGDTAAITLPVSQADTSEWKTLSLNVIQNYEPWFTTGSVCHCWVDLI